MFLFFLNSYIQKKLKIYHLKIKSYNAFNAYNTYLSNLYVKIKIEPYS